MKKKLLLINVLIPLFVIGCSSPNGENIPPHEEDPIVEPDDPPVEDPIAVTSISLNKTSFDLDVDASTTLTATIYPSTATNKSLSWHTSDASIAIVNNGVVTGVSEGSAVIMAVTVDGNKSASCTVNVKEPIPNYVMYGLYKGYGNWTSKVMEVNGSSSSEWVIRGVQLYENDLFKIHMYGDKWYGYSEVKTSTASGLVTRGSSNDNIRVLTTGIYDIYSSYNESDSGHIYIGRVDGGGSSQTVNVTGITLSHTAKYLIKSNEFNLVASVWPSDATNQNVTWRSSDENVARVYSSGRVYGVAKGTAYITATSEDGNKKATCMVYVTAQEDPDYYLNGTIGSYNTSYGYGDYKYAAIPLEGATGHYIIPDVELVSGNSLKIRKNNGGLLKNKFNSDYVYNVSSFMRVNIYLHATNLNYNYLTFVDNTHRDILVKYSVDTNNSGYCGWIWVEGDGFDPYWLKSTDLSTGSESCHFEIPKTATRFVFAQGNRNATPGNTYQSMVSYIYNTRTRDITQNTYIYNCQ